MRPAPGRSPGGIPVCNLLPRACAAGWQPYGSGRNADAPAECADRKRRWSLSGHPVKARRSRPPSPPGFRRPAAPSPPTASMACVPLISEIASLASSCSGSIAGLFQRLGRRPARRPSTQTSPSPIRTAARWAKEGARSPLAPTDPCDGITGCKRWFSRSQSRSITTGLTPLYPLASELARNRSRARVSASLSGTPHSGRVRAHQIDLQFPHLRRRNANLGQHADPGGNGVGRTALSHYLFHHLASPSYSQTRLRLQHYRPVRVDHLAQILQRKIVAVQTKSGVHASPVFVMAPRFFPMAPRRTSRYLAGNIRLLPWSVEGKVDGLALGQQQAVLRTPRLVTKMDQAGAHVPAPMWKR